MFTVASFIITKIGNSAGACQQEGWINKLIYSRKEYYSATKKNESLISTTT